MHGKESASMNNILAAIVRIDFLAWLWIFVIAYAFHELEEWNILRWYQRNYVDLPPSTDKAVRVWIVFLILVCFIWCAVATLPGNPVFAAYAFLPTIAVAMQNALQHVYWLFYFKQYAPGVVTSAVLLIPLGVYVTVQAVWQAYVPLWYVGILTLLIIPGLVQTVQAKNRMTKQIRAIHHLGIKLAGLLERRA
jgi:hypothetical protein